MVYDHPPREGEFWRPDYEAAMRSAEIARVRTAREAAREANLNDESIRKLIAVDYQAARPGRRPAIRRPIGAHEVLIVRMPDNVRAGEVINAGRLVVALVDAARGEHAPAIGRGPVTLPGHGKEVRAGETILWPTYSSPRVTATKNELGSGAVGVALADAPAGAATIRVQLGG